ncbi:hypothetical protein BP5796_06898 [Coleophoma crateriformis]|uniref:Cyanovirin-N domain-containing protein n=1 Tax=Coleophoma crateriformis TaxID=565419 RepID=A0A3D8RPS4_9HELO|nr:hypothetical protein BP5796_06898 [Coleophoma crateriformis]
MRSFTFTVATILSTLALSQADGGFYTACDPSTFTYQRNYTGKLGFSVTLHGWLSGECETADGTYTNSTVDLSSCIMNNNANLSWRANGSFVNTCQCDIASLPQLCCTCDTATNAKKSGVCIDLNDQVASMGGQLGCPDVMS